MRQLERRVTQLEDSDTSQETKHDLSNLSVEELERLEQIVIARDAGEWSDMSELPADDLRILAKIRVVGVDE